ncbi:MAG: nucleotidyltransferase domain-containing protein [Alphaproteobacteria bacterium]|nr:nucleotidyltransferase domain-containing protein [Alphaproteobacteria bacterium]
MVKAVVAKIDARLRAIEAEHRVVIPLAVESGSRAWGFPSPDSDYDCRFLYVRHVDDYLSLFVRRDVIETPLDGGLDVNGWDLAKALKLLLKGNAVVIEWLTSPIVYCGRPWFRDEFLALARRVADRELVARHYLHLGERQRHAYFADDKLFQLKKLFYALRPAAALRWLRLHPGEAVAPMHFPTLLAGCGAPDEVAAVVQDLIARKAVTRELGQGKLPACVAAFIDSEFETSRRLFDGGSRPSTPAARNEAQRFFRAALARCVPSG